MAENKKSFILYADQIGLFKKLTDVKAGKLIKLIFDYVNDENPQVDDLLLQIAFEPIKLQLKRDLHDWEKTKAERSESGKLGNLKKWHKDLYDKISAGEMNIKEAEIIVNNRKLSHSDNVVSLSIAKVAVNVNDTVNVNESDIKGFLPLFRIEECLTVAMNDPRWVNANNVLKTDLEEFNSMLEGRGVYEKNPLDYKTHYHNWNKTGRKNEDVKEFRQQLTSSPLKKI